MATGKTTPLTPDELNFWERAFLGAELTVLLKDRGQDINPAGAAHIAAEYATAAIAERRRAAQVAS